MTPASSLQTDTRGLLPEGIHDVTWDELEALFGRFQHSDRRHKLCQKLKAYLYELRKWEIGEAVVIDGSFVMASVDEPSDIDVVVLMPPGWEQRELLPVEENLLGKQARRTYRVQASPLTRDSGPARQRVDFYAQVNIKWCQKFDWPPTLKKGLLRIIP